MIFCSSLQIQQPVDILDVFRRPQDLAGHLEDILAMEPRPDCVWLQSGIRCGCFLVQLLSCPSQRGQWCLVGSPCGLACLGLWHNSTPQTAVGQTWLVAS